MSYFKKTTLKTTTHGGVGTDLSALSWDLYFIFFKKKILAETFDGKF